MHCFFRVQDGERRVQQEHEEVHAVLQDGELPVARQEDLNGYGVHPGGLG